MENNKKIWKTYKMATAITLTKNHNTKQGNEIEIEKERVGKREHE